MQSSQRPAQWAGVLGAASGGLSLATEDLPLLPEGASAAISAIGLNAGAMWPGVCFGAVIAFLTWRLGGRRTGLAVAAALATFLAWRLAVECALKVFDLAHAWSGSEPAALGVAGFAAGLVGALATVGVPLLAVPSHERWSVLTTVVLAGAGFGVLLRWSLTNEGVGALLFVTWQAAVAFAIGRGLARRARPSDDGTIAAHPRHHNDRLAFGDL